MNIAPITYRIMLAALLLLPTACTLGPEYAKPTLVTGMPATFKEQDGWKVAQPGDGNLTERWWQVYGDPVLNSLEEQVATANLTVASAEARFRLARSAVQIARAGSLPTVTAGASATRAQRSANLAGGNGKTPAPSWDYQIPVDAAWELDLWGRVRRSVEASEATARASAADLAAITLSAQAELAADYLQLRVLDAQRQLLDDTTAAYRKSLDLTNNRYAAGIVAKADVLQAETQLRSTEAQAIDLGVQRAQMEHAIAILTGKPPATFSLAVTPLATVLPAIPTGVPSDLLERRPDIASAERQMAAANAQIGIAKAAWYPAVRLSAAAGLEAATMASWFTWPSRLWSVGTALSATLFDGGVRKAQSEQALAAYDATVAAYRETVLTAFQEVEDNLAALRILEDEMRVQDQAVKAAEQVVTITTNQYQSGTVAYLNVLVAQTTALANQRTSLGLQGRRLTASVQLIKALGGGWQPTKIH